MKVPTTTASFQTERQAKEYLVERIIAEAQREKVPLSEIERKTLYFTESGWTLPNIREINAEVERDYDNEDDEQKIAALVREIDKQNETAGGDEQSKWDDAIVKLAEGDHYLLVLIGLGRSSPARRFSEWLPASNFYSTGRARPPGDFLRLIVVALVLAVVMLVAVVTESWLKK